MSDKENKNGNTDDDFEEEIVYVDEYGRPLPPPPPGMPYGGAYPPPPFPPPYGRPPFPPPHPGMPFPPPMQWVEETEVYEEDDDAEDEEDSSENAESRPPPPPATRVSHVQRNSFRSAPPRFGSDVKTAQQNSRVKEISDKGRLAREAGAIRSRREAVFKIFKVTFGLACIAAMILGCVLFVFKIREGIMGEGAADRNVQESVGIIGYRLGNSAEEKYVKDFYYASGDAEVGAWRDIILKGILNIEGKNEGFYCIKKPNGKTFLKIGNPNEDRSYIIGDFTEGVMRLPDGRISGPKEAVSLRMSLLIRALVYFDGSIFSRAFAQTSDTRGLISPVKLEPDSEFRGRTYNAISVLEPDGTNVVMYFNKETRLLDAVKYEKDGETVSVVYDKYEIFQKPYNVPSRWTVYSGSAVFAIADITLYERDRGVFFPY